MKYEIKKLEVISENGVATKQLLTLEVTRENGETSEHGKYIPLEADAKEEAVIFAAELAPSIQEQPVITKEEVEIHEKDKEVKESKIQARLEALVELQSEKLEETDSLTL